MPMRVLLCAIFLSLSVFGIAHAKQLDRSAQSLPIAQQTPQKLKVPGTSYEITLGTPRSQQGTAPPPDALLAAIVTWLSINFDLPRISAYPTVRFASGTKIATFRYTGLLSDKPRDVAAVPPGQREVVAAYDGLTDTIYLPEGWTGSTPAELSVLVHEMVHHLQNVARIRYECAQASEELAYAAQEKWLSLFGHSLASDFDVDKFTLLVISRCIY